MQAHGSTGRLIAGNGSGVTGEGQHAFVQLRREALRVDVSMPERGWLPRWAREHELDVRDLANPLGINGASNRRRYASQRAS